MLRKDLARLTAYRIPPRTTHHKGNIARLDKMEAPFTLWDEADIARIAKTVALNRYPASQDALTAKLHAWLGLPTSQAVLLGNGSDELIQIATLAFGEQDQAILAPTPTFSMYKNAAIIAGKRFVGVPLNADFSLDMTAMRAAISEHNPGIVWLAYPNNPTGNLFDHEAIKEILDITPGMVIVDEAYQAFAGESLQGLLEAYDNLMVMATLSKVGTAGLRFGYLIGAAPTVERLNALRLPYNLNVFTQAFIADLLARTKSADGLISYTEPVIAARAALYTALCDIPDITCYPSSANFILFRCKETTKHGSPHATAQALTAFLTEHGVFIKMLSTPTAHDLLHGCLRVSIGSHNENAQFLHALKNFYENT